MNLGSLKAAVRYMGGQVARGAKKAVLAEQATALRDMRLMECESTHMPAPDEQQQREQQQSLSMLEQQQPHQRKPDPPMPII